MKLKYKVLWFDDSSEIFDSLDLDYLRGEISSWGFIPELELVTTAEDFIGGAPYKDYDLLVFDYDLQDQGHGETFITNVRDQEVFTEIIFYSSSSASVLWDAIHKNQLEGIYIANKDNILERIIKVGHQALRKVLDLENMRGIVMAEVGDLDFLLNDILLEAMGDLKDEEQAEVFDGFYKACSEQNGKHSGALEEFKQKPSVAAMLSLCDSNKRWANYRRVLRHHGMLQKRLLGDYVAEVLSPRNFLAHGMPSRLDDGSFVFNYNGKDFAFNDEVSMSLRRKIIDFKAAFMSLKDEMAGAR